MRNASRSNDVLSHAGAHASVDTCRLLALHGGDFQRSNALHRAAEADGDRVEVLQWLLDDRGVPVNQLDFEYEPYFTGDGSALHCAVRAKSLERVKFLLGRGIDLNLKDPRGRTARDIAHRLGHAEIVVVLEAWEGKKG